MARRVLLLFGGGLDSLLADAVLGQRGVAVTRLHFDTGFVKRARSEVVARLAAHRAIRVEDVWRPYLRDVVLGATHRRGAGMNPCIDCRIFMLRKAAQRADASGIDRIATGDVLGQRALDQSRRSIERIDRAAGVAGRVDRPLSAGLLEPAGASVRALAIHGSARREQLRLARELGLEERPTPSGGCCLLADRGFARRLRDLVEHREAGNLDRFEIDRLRWGRHFRLDWSAKLVVARNRAEGERLEADARPDERLLRPVDRPGAVGLLDAAAGEDAVQRAAGIVARYSERAADRLKISVCGGGRDSQRLAAPAPEDRVRAWRI